MEDRLEISWLKSKNNYEVSDFRVGGYVLRQFTHNYTIKDIDPKTKVVKSSKQAVTVSFERYKILKMTDTTITIDEVGHKPDGSYGYREYSRTSGYCFDDKVYPHFKCRRKLNLK